MVDILVRIGNLRFKHLQVFEQAVLLGSTHKTARALHMTQPAVVKIIQQMEDLLGVLLFERTTKGLLPTEYADFLLKRIKPILGDARIISEELISLRKGNHGHVVIGTLISASSRLLPEAIVSMKKMYPNITITVREATNDILFPMLVDGDLDIVVGRLPEQVSEELETHILYDDFLEIVVRKDHPITQKEEFNLADTLDYPWILPVKESPVRQRMEGFFAQQSLSLPKEIIESLSLITNIGIVFRSETIFTLPSMVIQPFLKFGFLAILPVENPIPFGSIGYTIRSKRLPTPTCRLFIKELEKVINQLSNALTLKKS